MFRLEFAAMFNLTLALALLLQAPRAMIADVAKLASCTANEQRFDALTAMLTARKLPFTVESFKIEKPIRTEPRSEGRNVTVVVGDGGNEILIGAHYDAVRLPDGSLSKGAVDNAASSVMLVHLAEALMSQKLPMTIRFVWFDMEELGLIGSQRYLQMHSADNIATMLNFDVNGYGNTILFGPSERQESMDLRRTFIETCGLEGTACIGFPQMPPGDDRSFVNAKIPTLSIGILPAIEAHQVWLLMNAGAKSGLAKETTPPIFETIHTAADTPEKVSEETMVLMLRFTTSLIRALASR
jgi:hypothetical protein